MQLRRRRIAGWLRGERDELGASWQHHSHAAMTLVR